jgi:RNA polymerase sigma-70 factor (ECF subfamily)
MRAAYYAATGALNLCFDDNVGTDDEQELQRAWREGDFRRVVELALERYGHEIFAVLVARLGSESDASDVFQIFAVDLWAGLPGFQWRCGLRAWAHRIARNAAARFATARERSPGRNLSIEQGGVSELAERVSSTTLAYLRTEVKSEVRRLREQLPWPEQMLLILRVDRSLPWREIAAAFAEHDLDDDELEREAARWRKRFQLVIEKLRALARARGILDH